MSRPGTLYGWVGRVGSVTIKRGSLQRFAHDLDAHPRNLQSLIRHMASVGQVTEVVGALRFSARRQCVAKLGDFFPRYLLRSMERAA